MKKNACVLIILFVMALLLAACVKKTDGRESAPETEETKTESATEETRQLPDFSDTADSENEPNISDTTTSENVPEKPDQSEEPFEITMLDVGQGLCVLVQSGDKYLIYDGGGRDSSSFVVSYLKQHGITDIEYLFASHYDVDHIAGLIGLLKTVSVKTAVIPSYETDTSIYGSFMNAVTRSDNVMYAEKGKSFQLNGTKIEILYACTGNETNENDRSTVIRISNEGFSAIMTGDAESAAEKTLVDEYTDLGCTLYIVGHHGSSTSSSEDFVRALHPEVAFISAGKDNEYGHPTETVLKTLADNHVTVYRTDISGNLTISFSKDDYLVTADGGHKSNLKETDPEPGSESVMADVTYVLNTSSMKFHRPDCEAVTKMADHNKAYVNKSRNELIDEGYSPCGLCCP